MNHHFPSTLLYSGKEHKIPIKSIRLYGCEMTNLEHFSEHFCKSPYYANIVFDSLMFSTSGKALPLQQQAIKKYATLVQNTEA